MPVGIPLQSRGWVLPGVFRLVPGCTEMADLHIALAGWKGDKPELRCFAVMEPR